MTVESENTNISSLKNCRASTQRKKQYMLQNILQYLIDKSVKLDKFSMRISYIPKFPLSNEELKKYLEEQKNLNKEDWLIQLLLSTYGLRINTITLMKLQNLEFLKAEEDEENLIHLPDSKVKNHRIEPIEEELEDLLKEWVGNDLKDDDYIFYWEGKHLNWRRRAQDLCIRINKCISTLCKI